MRSLAAILLITAAITPAHAETFPWREVRDDIHAGVATGEEQALVTAAGKLETGPAEPAAWRAYWLGYIAYRRAQIAHDKAEVKSHLKDCATAVGRAIEHGERSGESHALLGGCYGQLADGGALAGMKFGNKSQSALDEALLDAPENPRVLLQAGISDLYTPVQWGGDPERAVRRLQATREQLERASPGAREPWLPGWGDVDAAGHLAIALDRLGHPDRARDVLREAARAGLESAWLTSIARRLEGGAESGQ